MNAKLTAKSLAFFLSTNILYEDVLLMRNALERIFIFLLMNITLFISILYANQTCPFFAHQPKQPQSVSKLRKF